VGEGRKEKGRDGKKEGKKMQLYTPPVIFFYNIVRLIMEPTFSGSEI
jgi:hypothetical protein